MYYIEVFPYSARFHNPLPPKVVGLDVSPIELPNALAYINQAEIPGVGDVLSWAESSRLIKRRLFVYAADQASPRVNFSHLLKVILYVD